MFEATIYDAAGETHSFFYQTGKLTIQTFTDTHVVGTARITEGPLTGEAVTIVMDGRDFMTGYGKVKEMTHEVDGVAHFSAVFDRALSAADMQRGLSGDVVAHGNRFGNFMSGDTRGDRIFGGGGGDTLYGEGGRDLLMGGDGRDHLIGGNASDRLYGGRDGDRFIFEASDESRTDARDVIADFQHRVDEIDLRRIDARDHSWGNAAFHFIGDDRFDGSEGALRYEDGILAGDIDGDRNADFQIRFANDPVIGVGDILL